MGPPAGGEATLTFPLHHRFFTGILVIRFHWEPQEDNVVFRADVDSGGSGFSQAGKSLLALGALASLPPILCWYFPSLMPMVPLSLLLVFLAWLGAARKPAYFTPEFFLRRLQTELCRRKA